MGVRVSGPVFNPVVGATDNDNDHPALASICQAGEERPTAALCFDDWSAIRLMHASQSAGLKIPEDLSITGCNDEPRAMATNPNLTTIRFPKEKLGAEAAKLVEKLVLTPRKERMDVHRLLPVELVPRQSTQAPAKSRKAFTLIEMLVVIAIIALLASLLLPVINRALVSAKTSASRGNLRSMHQAMFIYATESDTISFPAGGYTGNLKEYVPESLRSRIFVSPNAQRPVTDPYDPRTYAINLDISSSDVGRSLSEISRASEVILFADAAQSDNPSWQGNSPHTLWSMWTVDQRVERMNDPLVPDSTKETHDTPRTVCLSE